MFQIIGPREMNWEERRGEERRGRGRGRQEEERKVNYGHGYFAVVVVRFGQCTV